MSEQLSVPVNPVEPHVDVEFDLPTETDLPADRPTPSTRSVADSRVKDDLDVILLTLVRQRQGREETNGKALMDEIARRFGTQLSPGTVYPCLHELAEAGLLLVHERVRTKEYVLDDEERVEEHIGTAMHEHFALANVFGDALRGE